MRGLWKYRFLFLLPREQINRRQEVAELDGKQQFSLRLLLIPVTPDIGHHMILLQERVFKLQ
ncbi:hypothetical protein H5410_026097 [Solanum commersonii]|uniref:Uncharacterized protein n=1 Tax=Solanum commersonii TaxID=4109 RepID=A0A9J5YXQ7_SOLCO|nr:hypothetical protein H5410_026097 [Solanum commersonii]